MNQVAETENNIEELMISATGLAENSYLSGRIAGLDTAISLIRSGIAQLPVGHPDRLFASDDLGRVLLLRFAKSGRHEDVNEAVSLHRDTLELRSEFHPDRSCSLYSLAYGLIARSDILGRSEDLDEAIALLRDLLMLRPGLYPDRYTSLTALADTLFTRFEYSGQQEDLDEAISLYRNALELRSMSHPGFSRWLDNFIQAIGARFDLSKRSEDLEEIISLLRVELELRPSPHPDRYSSLRSLAITLFTRFKQSGRREDLDDAISLHRNALELRSAHNYDRSGSLSDMVNALIMRFNRWERSEDLDEAISLHRNLLELRPAPHPARYTSLSNLAAALFKRFEISGKREDLDESISLHRNALELQSALHSDLSSSLDNIANGLIARFNSLQRSEDLDEAIALYREALGLRPAPHPDRSSSLGDLAAALFTRFKHSGRWEVDEVIALYREALELLPAPHPYEPGCRFANGLANALGVRFDQQSDRYEDMEEAILLLRHALELLPAHHPERHIYLYNIANALVRRSTQLHQPEDLEEAISLHRNALELSPTSHPQRFTYLKDLAVALSRRFAVSAQLEDSDEAITLCREALSLLPAPHPDRASCLIGLVTMLRSEGRQSNDLDEGIQLLRDALDLEPESHHDESRAMYLYNLALAGCRRFTQSNQPADLELAINSCHMSLNTLASRHPNVCSVLVALGDIFMTAYSKTHELEYLDKSMGAFRDAVTCESASTFKRFHTARLWALLADDSRHASALDAYRAAIELLPRLAMFGLDLQSRQQSLTYSNGLACDAAACAIRLGQYEQAVELLEEGRAVFWSQAPRLHTPMTDLNETAPELAVKLTRISLELERSSLPHMSRNGAFDAQQIMSMTREASRSHHLGDEWLATLEEVRQLDGFHDFLRPKRLSTLQDAAVHSPVVILNASERSDQCAALILTSTGVRHVPLHLNMSEVVRFVKYVRNTIEQEGRYDSLPESNRTNVDPVQQMLVLSDTLDLERHIARVSDTSTQFGDFFFRLTLARLFIRVALPIIQELNLEKSDSPPRLHWCPIGPFAFLPIHAAGLYFGGEEQDSISNYAVSSYTPTISALLGSSAPPINSFKMMAVIQPDTPGQRLLPNTLNELCKIEAHVPNEDLIRLVRGSVEEVVSYLPKASIAHFACHGQQNTQNPFDSALLLQDGQLKISQIMQQSMPNASLAFLSACETATGHKNLPDESIHFGAALLFAGFRGVVATMWSISDLDGPKIAEAFYENIFRESNYTSTNSSGPDTTQAARALHLAVAKLRAENVPLTRWVSFIHLGK